MISFTEQLALFEIWVAISLGRAIGLVTYPLQDPLGACCTHEVQLAV